MSLNKTQKLRFEPFAIAPLVDATGHYDLKLDPEFPLSIKLFSYETLDPSVRLNWHNRLEIFVPVSGRGVFRMGVREIEFDEGDVLVVDNLKLHGLSSFQGRQRRAVVVSFKAELFYHLGSPLCDFFYLTPFFNQDGEIVPLLRATDALSPQVHQALGQLLECYFKSPGDPYFKSGCKSWLSVILYLLAQRDVAHVRMPANTIGWRKRAASARSDAFEQVRAKMRGSLLQTPPFFVW